MAQAVAGSTVPVLFLISGLMGPRLAPTLGLSTLPMSLVVIGVAVASPLAGFAMSRLGRKLGHLLGLAVTIAGVTWAGFALAAASFTHFCMSCLVAGVGSAFNNQIRFSAAETAGEEKALVHSWVLMFSLFSALIGPGLTEWGRDRLSYGAYTGSVAVLVVLLALLFALLLALPRDARQESAIDPGERVPVRALLGQSRFWLAALSGMASFATMTLLMSATPLQMHTIEHFTHADTTSTIQSHIIAMYLPSLFSGVLLAWLGIRRLIVLGVALFFVCIGIASQGSSYMHYWWALVLLGVGWNFLFLAGSTWISQSYSGPERFAAQGAHDAVVYGTQSIASLAAGGLLFSIGWQSLVLVPVPFLVVLLVFTALQAPERRVAISAAQG